MCLLSQLVILTGYEPQSRYALKSDGEIVNDKSQVLRYTCGAVNGLVRIENCLLLVLESQFVSLVGNVFGTSVLHVGTFGRCSRKFMSS